MFKNVSYESCVEYFQEKKYSESLDIATKILKDNPSNVDVNYIAGLCYSALNDFPNAAEKFNICTNFDGLTNRSSLFFNLGYAYAKQKQTELAIDAYKKSLEIDPNNIGALNNLANIYNELGNNDLALKFFNRLIENGCDEFFVHCNISLIYKRIGNLNEAYKSIKKAVEASPDGYEQNYNAAIICVQMGNYAEAVLYFERAYVANPNNLVMLIEFKQLLTRLCDWEGLERIEPVIENAKKIDQTDLFVPLTDNSIKNERPDLVLESTKRYIRDLTKKTLEIYSKFEHKKPDISQKNKKLRIAYMSSDIKNHPVAHLTRGVFRCHDKEKFDIYLYSFSDMDRTGYQKEIAGYCTEFRDHKAVSVYDTAKAIYDDKIDILIDLNGHTGSSRIESLVLKPAPIQVNYLGFIGSMGSEFTDYIIADKYVTPQSDKQFYTEEFVYMPDCYQANDNKLAISEDVVTKQEENLPEDKFIFCSFNQPYKIEPVMFDVWMNILKRVPNSVLWQYSGRIYQNDDLAIQSLRKEAKKRGVDPDRIIFCEQKKIHLHLKRAALADLALDTRLYNGGTVTSQTLWAGVPVVTLTGDHYASRMATSILHAIDMPELVTKSLQEYEDLAVELANNPQRVKDLKEKLENNKLSKPLFDTELFTKNLEKAYTKMWHNYCEGNKAKFIQV